MKRLNRECPSIAVDYELDTLYKVSRVRHPNLLPFLGVFFYEEDNKISRNLLFPMAIGDLKQLFEGSINQRSVLPYFDSLWSQFEGLASGLECLHDQLHLAHRDIQPSNILLYQHPHDLRLIAKLADFNSAERKWKKLGRIYQLQCYYQDVWKLGTVFAELLTYLKRGTKGVKQFRTFITVTHGRITSDTFKDLRFNETRVKSEVLEWLRRTPRYPTRGREVAEITMRMLGPRASAADVVKYLANVSWAAIYFHVVR